MCCTSQLKTNIYTTTFQLCRRWIPLKRAWLTNRWTWRWTRLRALIWAPPWLSSGSSMRELLARTRRRQRPGASRRSVTQGVICSEVWILLFAWIGTDAIFTVRSRAVRGQGKQWGFALRPEWTEWEAALPAGSGGGAGQPSEAGEISP